MRTSTDIQAMIAFEWLEANAPGFSEFVAKRSQEIRFPQGRAEDRPTRTQIIFSGVPLGGVDKVGVSGRGSVLKLPDGSFKVVQGPSPAQQKEALAYYRGGYQNEISEQEAAELEAAGFRVNRRQVPA